MSASDSTAAAPGLLNAAPAGLALLAGVDGGGTGTRVRLQALDGRELGSGEAGPSSLSQGIAQAWQHVQQALAAAAADAGVALPAPAHIGLALGVAGGAVAHLHAAFRQANPGYALGVLENDGVTQLAGAHGGQPGVVVSAGTGTVAGVLSHSGQLRSCGGWGWPVGDEGGGANLGLHAVRALQAVLDGRAAAGPLAESVAAALGADLADPARAAECVLHWTSTAGQHAYASLAPLVFEAAEAATPPDPLAAELLQDAAGELARLVAALCRDPADASLPVVLNGSIGQRLARRWPPVLRRRLVSPQADSAAGALLLLRQRWKLPVSPLVTQAQP